MRVISALCVSAAAAADSCPGTDKVYDAACGGAGFVAILNVSDQGECCAKCHGDFHDECQAWIFGDTPGSKSFNAHNCVIMPHPEAKRTSQTHICGIVAGAPTPPPAPTTKPCRADIDCDIAGSEGWRCAPSSTVSATAASNCHPAGPGTKGNSTCGCTTPKCASGPAMPVNSSAIQYLMVGDSISMGMRGNVAASLALHGVELTHNPGNAASSNLGQHCLKGWLQTEAPANRVWDVISFQFGLHDLAFDNERIAADQYRALLTGITSDLVAVQKKSGSKLLWVSTTPVPTVPTYGPGCNVTSECLNPPRFDSDVVLYNAVADDIMDAARKQGADISKLDLYSVVIEKCGGRGYSKCPGFQLDQNVHYTQDGWQTLGQHMSDAVLELVGSPTSSVEVVV